MISFIIDEADAKTKQNAQKKNEAEETKKRFGFRIKKRAPKSEQFNTSEIFF
jgi:hypothetical protein